MVDEVLVPGDNDRDEETEREVEKEADEGMASNEEEDDDESAVVMIGKELPVGDDDDEVDAIAEGLASPPSRLRAEKPQVCGAAGSIDVISNVGVFLTSIPAGL